jgi:hypothetical protein
MKKRTLFWGVSGLFTGSTLASFGLRAKDWLFWVISICFFLILDFLYSKCKED